MPETNRLDGRPTFPVGVTGRGLLWTLSLGLLVAAAATAGGAWAQATAAVANVLGVSVAEDAQTEVVRLPVLPPFDAAVMNRSEDAVLRHPPVLADADALSSEDVALLDDIQRTAVRFFWEQGHPQTGLVADRAPADGSGQFEVSSIAATGFGLTSLCIAQQRGWLTEEEAYGRALTTLRFLWEKMPHERGWFYHFVNHETGQRVWNCELSSIDTALLLAGVLTVRQAYPDSEAAELATKIYERVDFPWMLNERGVFSMGWSPERGFLAATWDGYSEHPLLYLLGIGSPTHPIPATAWTTWSREPAMIDASGRTFLACPPMFTHQFSHAFVDFRGMRDDVADYWHNSVLATQAHYRMCVDELSERFPHYSAQLWGITASDFAGGYTAWGGPPITDKIDGTLVPCGPAGAIVFMPDEALETLRYMRQRYGDRIWQHYGFVDAFNPQTGWIASDVLGIDQGISAIMIENLRTGSPWRWFMANPEIREAMRRAGFRDGEAHEVDPTRMTSLYGAEAVPAEMVAGGWRGEPGAKVRRLSVGWDKADWHAIAPANTLGEDDRVKRAKFAALWDDAALHLRLKVEVADEAMPPTLDGEAAQNFVEVFLDPVTREKLAAKDPVAAASTLDLRFRFVPPLAEGEILRRRRQYDTRIVRDDKGYTVDATIPWASLSTQPQPHGLLRASVSVLEGSVSGPAVIKQNWRLRTSGRSIELGWLTLIP